MRKWGLTVFLALCALGVVAEYGDSAETVPSAFVKGNEFLEFSEARQRAYVMGLVDGFLFSPVLCHGTLPQLRTCLEGMNDVEIAALLSKFVRNQPEISHYSSHHLMYEALLEICLQKEVVP